MAAPQTLQEWTTNAESLLRISAGNPFVQTEAPTFYSSSSSSFDQKLLEAPSDAPPDWSAEALRLEVLRAFALNGGQFNHSLTMRHAAARPCREWLDFLLNSPHAAAFAARIRARDEVFYDFATLQPRPRSQRQNGWQDQLPWLGRDASAMTILEFEIALVLFTWDVQPKDCGAPRFALWLEFFPHVLAQVEAFALRRYAWTLLRLLRQARKLHTQLRKTHRRGTEMSAPSAVAAPEPANFDLPAHQAGRGLRWQPRIHALVLVGLFAVIGVDSVQAFLFGGPWFLVLPVAAAAAGMIWLIADIDVYKRNHGLIVEGRTHARSRVFRLFGRFLGIGILWSLPLTVLLATAGGWSDGALTMIDNQSPRTNLVAPGLSGVCSGLGWPIVAARLLLGTVAQGVVGALLGSLLNWIWQDRSATEPL